MTDLADRKKAARAERDRLRKKYNTLKDKADDIYEVMHWNIPEWKAKALNDKWLKLMDVIHPIREEMDAAQHYYEHLQKKREPRPKKPRTSNSSRKKTPVRKKTVKPYTGKLSFWT